MTRASAAAGQAQIDIGHEPALFEGHFPGHPILPGARLLDLVIAELRRQSVVTADALEIVSAKFLALVPPDSQVDLTWSTVDGGQCRFECLLDGQKVATGSLRPVPDLSTAR